MNFDKIGIQVLPQCRRAHRKEVRWARPHLPSFFQKKKKFPNFMKKYPDCVHL